MKKKTKIKIIGAGPTGSVLAIALSKAGSFVNIFDNKSEQQLSERSRAYALTNSSRQMLDKLGLWPKLSTYIVPFNTLYLEDQVICKHLIFNNLDLPKNNNKSKEIGWIIDHKNLMKVLLECMSTNHFIQTSFNKTNQDNLDYDLVIAADGPQSLSRREWNIKSYSLTYKQSCITAKVLIRGAKSKTAYEIFRSEGPMALLPMGNDLFQVVWSAPTYLAKKRMNLNNAYFLDYLAATLPNDLQPDQLVEMPYIFPLQLSISPKLFTSRKLLVGESSHRCHPVGGQGLNLCWRDVEELTRLVGQSNRSKVRISSIPLLFNLYRITDIVLVSLFTDLLVRIFSTDHLFINLLRGFSLDLMSKLPILKKISFKVMSFGPMSILKNI